VYEDAGSRLYAALVAAFGDVPRCELSPNGPYGFYRRYDQGDLDMGAIRAVIDTLNVSASVILAPRGYDPSWVSGRPHRPDQPSTLSEQPPLG
jgi:hypothetical protein